MKFSFLGLGNMGAPLANNILEAGESLTVYDLLAERCAKFAEAGATVAPSLKALTDCDVICTCLPLPEHLRSVLLGPDGLYVLLKPGLIHLEFSTIDPETASDLSNAAQDKGLSYIQCTVGKTPQMAWQKQEPLFVGGEAKAVEKLFPLLEKIGKPTNVGSIEASCAVKLLSNMIGMSNLVVLAEGLKIGKSAGMDLHLLLKLLEDTGACSFQLDVRGPWIADGDYSQRFSVDMAAKDLRLGCAMSKNWGFEPALMEKALDCLDNAHEAGLGAEDVCAVYKALG